MMPSTIAAPQPATVTFRSPAPTTIYTTTPSPIGDLLLLGDGAALTGLHMPPPDNTHQLNPSWTHQPAAFRDVIAQLDAYFAGLLTAFHLPLAPSGTPFQLQVWQALCAIPYGHTTSYGQLATRLGNPKASRAVGLANGRNPIAVIIPCHRVIGANGTLTGFGGGLHRKRQLLDLESPQNALALTT